MGLLSWARKKEYEGAQQRISQMQLDINKFRTKSARDTAEREASILKSLKDSVYEQDQSRISSLIELFDQLDSQQIEMAGRLGQIKQRISKVGIQKSNKKSVNRLVKSIEKATKGFDDLVRKNRADIENIKASIKDNDFKFAEMLINRVIESQQDLKKKTIEIEGLEKGINRKLITPTKSP